MSRTKNYTQKDRDAGLQQIDRDGRKVAKYDPRMAVDIVEQIAMGGTLNEVLKRPKMPSKSTFYRWVLKSDALRRAFDAARELSAKALEDEALDMARTLKEKKNFTGTKVRAFEVAMNQLRWSATRRDPATYGQHRQDGGSGVTVNIQTSLPMGGGGGVQSDKYGNVFEIKFESPGTKPPEGHDVLDLTPEDVPAEDTPEDQIVKGPGREYRKKGHDRPSEALRRARIKLTMARKRLAEFPDDPALQRKVQQLEEGEQRIIDGNF